jgi:uncharacterized protein YcaQ
MLKLSWPQAAAWRVRRHHLDRRAPAGSMLTVASRLCGLHAQLMSSAELTVWARVEDLDRKAVQRALWEDRSLVKTWAMRGTLHLLPAGELPLWRAALSTSRRFLRAATWQKHFGITLEELDQVTEAVATALDGRLMTREELVREVCRLTGSAAFGAKLGQSWGTMLRPAAFAGHLCFAPSVGQRVRFTRPDTWLAAAGCPPAPAVDPQAAPAAITRRFLASYGPATFHDLARWWGGSNSVTTARQWIASMGEEVTPVEVDGVQAWMLTADAGEVRGHTSDRSVRLLPGFDQYVVGASWHAEQLLPAGDLRIRVYRPQGWISPVLLVNGRMEGTWRHEIKGSRVEVVIEPFAMVPVWARRAAGQEAERLAAFLGCTLSLEWKGARL